MKKIKLNQRLNEFPAIFETSSLFIDYSSLSFLLSFSLFLYYPTHQSLWAEVKWQYCDAPTGLMTFLTKLMLNICHARTRAATPSTVSLAWVHARARTLWSEGSLSVHPLPSSFHNDGLLLLYMYRLYTMSRSLQIEDILNAEALTHILERESESETERERERVRSTHETHFIVSQKERKNEAIWAQQVCPIWRKKMRRSSNAPSKLLLRIIRLRRKTAFLGFAHFATKSVVYRCNVLKQNFFIIAVSED